MDATSTSWAGHDGTRRDGTRPRGPGRPRSGRAVVVAGAVVVAVALTVAACTSAPPRAPGIAPGAGASTAVATRGPELDPTALPAGASPAAPPAPSATVPARAGTNVPMTRLAPGEQPPQFVLFSFDGAGWHDRWQEFMTAADQVDARFTGFLTGIYLLTDDHRDAYTGPGHAPGRASVGFGGSPETVVQLVHDLNEAYARGHEIGTHYNGHFCSDNPPGGNQWTAADWQAELDQFFTFLADWDTIDRIDGAPELVVGAEDVQGGRTPCLEGVWPEISQAWAAHGLTYDSSKVAGGIAWPRVEDGVWQFPVPTVRSPAFGTVLAMDYNFWVKANGGADDPDAADAMRAGTLDTYRHMYAAARDGNRAPVVVANHFNRWSGNAFNPAARDFMLEVCDDEGTVCATYSDVVAWLDLQDPAVLAELQARPPVS